MKTFEISSLIDCRVEELYAFHLDVNNLPKITPPNMKVTLLNKVEKISLGTEIYLRNVQYYVPTYWRVRVDEIREPNLLVDLALESPFYYFRHQHIFTQKGDLCELRDVVEITLPLEFMTKFLYPFVLKQLQLMFEYRHSITKKILEQKK
ncbi:MAG: SRPBCC family protein [Thiovulaceae bacterium]|nr:SRPBCC family protein [Sulfurimonadaceae bacterium]